MLLTQKITEWYINQKEPVPQVGVTMGLSVMLDAHTDLLQTYTVDNDFNSFLGLYLFLSSYPQNRKNQYFLCAKLRTFLGQR